MIDLLNVNYITGNFKSFKRLVIPSKSPIYRDLMSILGWGGGGGGKKIRVVNIC